MPLLVVGAFLGGLQWQHAAVFSLAGALLVGSVFYPPVSKHILKPYQRERITSFLHPEEDAKGSGYQLLQSKIAVGSGGFWGKGFRNGSQNQLGYIPVRYSDFIMSAWAEEQGFKGVLIGLGFVYGVVAATRAECSTRERSRGNVSGHGRSRGARFPCFSKRGYGDRRYAGHRHPVAVNELRGLCHVVCFSGDWSGDECPASPLRQLSDSPVPSAPPDFVKGRAGCVEIRNIRVRTASSAVCPSRQRTGLESKRKCIVGTDPGVSGFHPSGFERKGISPSRCRPRISASRGAGYSSGPPSERKLAAMPSGGSDLIGATHSDDSAAPGLSGNRRKAAPARPAPHITRSFHVERIGYFRGLPRTAGRDFGRRSVSRNLHRARKRVRAGR